MASPSLFPGRVKPQTIGLLSAALPSPMGDAVGLLADTAGYAEDPKSLTFGSGLLSLAALAPGMPSKSLLNANERDLDSLYGAAREANDGAFRAWNSHSGRGKKALATALDRARIDKDAIATEIWRRNKSIVKEFFADLRNRGVNLDSALTGSVYVPHPKYAAKMRIADHPTPISRVNQGYTTPLDIVWTEMDEPSLRASLKRIAAELSIP